MGNLNERLVCHFSLHVNRVIMSVLFALFCSVTAPVNRSTVRLIRCQIRNLPCMVFGPMVPFHFSIKRKMKQLIIFFNLKFIGFGSFSMKSINQNPFSMTSHCAPTLHIYITYRLFGSTGHPHQLVPKQRRAARQQPAPGPEQAHQTA